MTWPVEDVAAGLAILGALAAAAPWPGRRRRARHSEHPEDPPPTPPD